MSYTIGSLVACSTLQADLNRYFQTCPVNEFMPFMEFLGSRENNFGLAQEVSPGNGKVRTVKLKYTPRLLESTVQSNVANPLCDVTNFIGDRWQDYTIDTDENVGTGFSMTPEQVAYSCTTNRDYFLERLNAAIDVIDRRLATIHTADLFAHVGKWATNVTQVNNELVVSTTTAAGLYNPTTVGDIDFALQKTSFCKETMIFAGTQLAAYYRNGIAAGCCSNQGIDVSGIFRAYGKAIAYDMRVEDNTGTNGAVAVQAGALALLHYNRATWLDDVKTTGLVQFGDEVNMVIRSPRTGVPMDLTVKYDCGKLSVWLVATTKLVALPTDIFSQGDRMLGVNFVAGITVTDPA